MSVAALLGCMAVLLAPAGAGAATQFGGADMTQTPGFSTMSLSITNISGPAGAPSATSPTTGVLTSVRIKTSGAAANGTIRVLTEVAHPSASSYDFLNSAPEISMPVLAHSAPGDTTEVLTRRPITTGQRLAWVTTDAGGGTFEQYGAAGAECAYTSGAHAVGTTVSYTTVACTNLVLLVSGTVEPDADLDGYGDETQDSCPSSASTHVGACPPPPAPGKKKCKKKKKKRAAAAKKKCKKKKR